jgi:hypothetical protein
MVETQDPGSDDLGVAQWLQEEAAIADSWNDPRNDDDYENVP